jgi:hypothetical protein
MSEDDGRSRDGVFVHRDGWRSIVDPYNHNSERWLDGGGASREIKIPR